METKERPRANDPVMPIVERALIAENLRLALDEIETGAGDLASVFNAVRFQREAIRTAHRCLNRLREAV